MTEWLTGTLVATSALILLVLLVREPVRRTFGARVTYGLWLIPAARLLMPTLTQTIERPMGPAVTPGMFTGQASAEPLLLSSVALPEPSLIEQAGGWPTILMVLWLGVAAGLFVARILAFREECAAILESATDDRPRRVDPPGQNPRSQRAGGVRHLRPRHRRPGGFRRALRGA